jgi:putative Holliday junction resolvase
MLLRNIQDLAVVLGPNARLLGLDVGTKTIGVAISDERRVLASGRKTVVRTKLAKDLDALASTCRHEPGRQLPPTPASPADRLW